MKYIITVLDLWFYYNYLLYIYKSILFVNKKMEIKLLNFKYLQKIFPLNFEFPTNNTKKIVTS